MKELNLNELGMVSGGMDSTKVNTGAALLGLGAGIAAIPAASGSILGWIAGAELAAFGGLMMGDGIIEGKIFKNKATTAANNYENRLSQNDQLAREIAGL